MRERCPDCGIDIGAPHQDGCDVARCTECGWQRISCRHGYSDLGWGAIWTGIWPGILECQEFGFWSYWGPPFIKCTKDHPDATEDLNELAVRHAKGMLVWDKKLQRLVKP